MEKGNYSQSLFQCLDFSEFFFSLYLEIFLFSYLECTDQILEVKMVLSHFRDVTNLGFCIWVQLLQGSDGLWCHGIPEKIFPKIDKLFNTYVLDTKISKICKTLKYHDGFLTQISRQMSLGT